MLCTGITVRKKIKHHRHEREVARPPNKRTAGDAVMREAVIANVKAWFAKLDSLGAAPLVPHGRTQPKTPRRKIFG